MKNPRSLYPKSIHMAIPRTFNFRNEIAFPTSELEKAYLAVCQRLNRDKNKRWATIKTDKEFKFHEIIKEATKLKFYSSVWIGRRNYDLFFPQFNNGIVIEINGDFHNHGRKIKQDESKLKILSDLNIQMTAILNEDFFEETVKNLVSGLSQLKVNNSRTRKEIFRKIYLKTIIDNQKMVRLDQFFTGDALKMLKNSQFPIKSILRGDRNE